MSDFEIDRHLREIAEKEQEKERQRVEAEREQKEEATRFNAEQKKVSLMIVNDLSQRGNLSGLVNEINRRIANNRGQIREYNLYEPRGISSSSFRIEFGPWHTSREIRPPRLLRKWVLKTNTNKSFHPFCVCQIMVKLKYDNLNGQGEISLVSRDESYEGVLEKQKSGNEIQEFESRIVKRERMRYGGERILTESFNEIDYNDSIPPDVTAYYQFENGGVYLHRLHRLITRHSKEEVDPQSLRTVLGSYAAKLVDFVTT